MIRNILWNVDGALFDTYPAVTYAYSKTLNGMGYSIPLNVIDRLVRTSFNDLADMLHQRFKLDRELIHARFTETYLNISPAQQPPFSGVREVCEYIHQFGGLNIAITHRSLDTTLQMFDAHNFAVLIDDVFSFDKGYPDKPDPSMILAALEKHSLPPHRTLFLSDRECDIQTGTAAGIRTCLFGRANKLQSADYQIENYYSLLDVLKEDRHGL